MFHHASSLRHCSSSIDSIRHWGYFAGIPDPFWQADPAALSLPPNHRTSPYLGRFDVVLVIQMQHQNMVGKWG